jgi:alpha-N-arabinofuranosidase
VHAYYDPASFASIDDYLACSADLDRTIVTVSGIVDRIAERHPGDRRIGLSVDEWNVWRLAEHQAREAERRTVERAPALAEDTADLADALVVGSLLLTLLRHADRVRIACVAQLVNVIPLIRTLDAGPAWLQTTAFPFADIARFARGTVLRIDPDGPAATSRGDGPAALDLAAVHDPATGALSCFLLNRSAASVELDAGLRDIGDLTVEVATVLKGADLRASNTALHPDRVRPVPAGAAVVGRHLKVTLPARSWTVVRLVRPAPASHGVPGGASHASGTVVG